MPKQGFQKGQSGNPAGRPPGARTKARLLAEAILESNRDDIINAVVAAAKDRDPTAMKICADRLLPLRRGAPVTFSLPAIKTATDVVTAIGTVVGEMASGELTPDEATAVAGVLEIERRAIETVDIDERLRKVEEAQAGGSK
jgi:hypothetical protein